MASRTVSGVLLLLLLLLVAPSSSLVTFDLHGNVHPVGCLYVTLKIGEPIREYNLDVGTGSILTWVQCNVPTAEETAKRCGYDQTWGPHQPPVDGLLGLVRGSSVSLIFQLKKEHAITKDVISHCISKGGGGFLHIGDYQHSTSAIIWVDMNPNAPSGHYSPKFPGHLHYGSSQGPLISKDPISVAFDSGSTYTYFTPQTYRRIEKMVTANLHKSFRKAQETEDNTLDLCWVGPKKFETIDEIKPFFKSIFIVFGKGNRKSILEMAPENYLIISQGHKNACFGILEERTNIIGAITMQDRIVIYDNVKRQIGWAHDSCKTRSGPVTTSRL